MKKSISIIVTAIVFAFTHMNFTEVKVIGTVVGVTLASKSHAQTGVNVYRLGNYYWWFVQGGGLDPTTGAPIVMQMSKDTFWLHEKYFMFDSLSKYNTAVSPSTKMMGLDGSGKLTVSSFSDITVPYSQITGAPSTSSYAAGTGLSLTGNTFANTAPDQVVSLTAGNTDISITGTYPNFVITPYVPTTYTVTRAINNSTFQPSNSHRVSMIYNSLVTTTTSIGGASDGIVQLQYSTNNGTTWLNATQMENASNATLAVALNLVNKQSGVVVLMNMPPTTIYRLVPTSTNATVSYITGFETY